MTRQKGWVKVQQFVLRRNQEDEEEDDAWMLLYAYILITIRLSNPITHDLCKRNVSM